jgi:hypothetical protein
MITQQETHSTNDHSPPKIRHSFQARDASMHDSIIDNNGLRKKRKLIAVFIALDLSVGVFPGRSCRRLALSLVLDT